MNDKCICKPLINLYLRQAKVMLSSSYKSRMLTCIFEKFYGQKKLGGGGGGGGGGGEEAAALLVSLARHHILEVRYVW